MDHETRFRLQSVLAAIDAGVAFEVLEDDGLRFARFVRGDCTELVALRAGDEELLRALQAESSGLVEKARRLQSSPPAPLTDEERSTLEAHGIVMFEGRFVHRAQPPASEDALAEVAAWLEGPIPDGLRALWSVAFGGELLYDLRVPFDGVPLPMSSSELFFPDSNHYHTLEGWMAHELELAQEAAEERGEAPPRALRHLPFGGFEYLERLYVDVRGGAVDVWRKALPPAWKGPLKSDAVARVADSVEGLFHCLEVVPETVPDPYGRAAAFRAEVVRPLARVGEEALAERVWELYLSTPRASSTHTP